MLSTGTTQVVREAKLYYTAYMEAYEAGGLVIDLTKPGHPESYEEEITNAERWRIGDKFIAAHADNEDTKGKPNGALRRPPKDSPFWASAETLVGDAEKTYNRLMTEKFGLRPRSDG